MLKYDGARFTLTENEDRRVISGILAEETAGTVLAADASCG